MEDVRTNQTEGINAGTGEKTFTQDDVNRIIGERLAKEKAKGEAEISKREQELAQRELRMTAKETLSTKGLPADLLDALNCSDRETMEKSIATIEKVFNEYKANATRNIKFKGFQPGASSDLRAVLPASEDAELRKAMGLRV